MSEHRIFDLDQHMYETRDTFTRHLPERYRGQAVAPVTLADGRDIILAGDKLMVALEPEFGEAYKPGSLKEMLKQMASGAPAETYMFEPMREAYQNRAARLAEMARQGIDATIMNPGGGRCSPRSTSPTPRPSTPTSPARTPT